MFNKKAVISVCLLFISINAFSQLTLTYKNTLYNYTINLPKSLEITELPSKEVPDTMVAENKKGSTVIIFVKQENAYKGVNAGQLLPNTFLPEFRRKYQEVNLLENDYTNINGEPAMYMKFNYKSENTIYVVIEFLLIRNSRLYTIRLIADEENIDSFSNELTGYLLTFQFVDTSVKDLYRNDIQNFIIKFPIGWPFDKNAYPVQANSPKGSSIYVESIKNSDFKDMTAYDLDENILVDALKSRFTGIYLVGKKRMTIDNQPSLFLKYRYDQTFGTVIENFYIMHYYVIHKNEMFIIQGMTKINNSKDDEKLIEETAMTFQFIK